ncbi:tetratricopeptide repeat protein [Belnapia sp. T6]|uniref:Tetratricopeptide repeat protein n=1 Tax=Belnapia mucosa TaxID=2804532 RepID=A0ABS1V1K8_9PROT|nr:tetratricopeptide repeat protein [Belnapia mucosa]MBL6455555.1 tetratricopeptide repeat protein [Belnapia mucosa]
MSAGLLGEAHRLAAAGEAAEALALYDQVLAGDPAAADAANNAGVLLRRRGAEEEALRRYRQALAAEPGHADAGWNLGRLLLERGEADEAFLHLRRAAALRPGWERWHGLGRACQARGDLAGAEAAYARALATRPEAVETLNNLATTHQAAGRPAAALPLLERALALAPGHADIRYNRALLLLLLGRWAEGWREHEGRWRAPGFASPRRHLASPAWDGRPIEGRLLLHWEQGLGDTIQFLRYAEAARARCGELLIEVQPPLLPLLRGWAGAFAAGDPVPPHEAHAPLLSLPHLLGEAEPRPGPAYLAADPARAAAWAARLCQGPRAGLVWAGNPRHLNDRNRSLPVAVLAPLLAQPGRRWISLQVGPRAADIAAAGLDGVLQDVAPALTDFAETAAALAQLDLLVTVDTAVAHLAGAMGVECWLLLPFAPDWRWGLLGERSPWYPSLRLFRQPAPGDSAGLLPALCDSLRRR